MLKSLLPKNNPKPIKRESPLKAFTEIKQEEPQPIKTPKKRGRKPKQTDDKPKEKRKISKKEIEKFKQQERENRAAKEYYLKQNRRKHAIINNYVKKQQEEASQGIINQNSKHHPTPANINNNRPIKINGIVKQNELNNINKQIADKRSQTQEKKLESNSQKRNPTTSQTKEKENKVPRPIINNNYYYNIYKDKEAKGIENAIQKFLVKQNIKRLDIKPTDDIPAIMTKYDVIGKTHGNSSARKYQAMTPLKVGK